MSVVAGQIGAQGVPISRRIPKSVEPSFLARFCERSKLFLFNPGQWTGFGVEAEFRTTHLDVGWCFDPQADSITADVKHLNDNLAPDDEPFPDLAAQHQHGLPSLVMIGGVLVIYRGCLRESKFPASRHPRRELCLLCQANSVPTENSEYFRWPAPENCILPDRNRALVERVPPTARRRRNRMRTQADTARQFDLLRAAKSRADWLWDHTLRPHTGQRGYRLIEFGIVLALALGGRTNYPTPGSPGRPTCN